MAYVITAVMTLSFLEGHSPCAVLLSVIFHIYGMSRSLSASAELFVSWD